MKRVNLYPLLLIIMVIPFLIIYMQKQILSSGYFLLIVGLVFFPIAIFISFIWEDKVRAKITSGKLKIYFSSIGIQFCVLLQYDILGVKPDVNINAYVLLITAIFFFLDGYSDLNEAFNVHYEGIEERLKKVPFKFYLRFLRIYILMILIASFSGLSVQYTLLYLKINHVEQSIFGWQGFLLGLSIFLFAWSITWICNSKKLEKIFMKFFEWRVLNVSLFEKELNLEKRIRNFPCIFISALILISMFLYLFFSHIHVKNLVYLFIYFSNSNFYDSIFRNNTCLGSISHYRQYYI